MDILGLVWPECPLHAAGLHVWPPAHSTQDRTSPVPADEQDHGPMWECRVGQHLVARGGELGT